MAPFQKRFICSDDEMKGFEDFCGGPVWDLNLTWNTQQPDFTRCFKDTILVISVCGTLWSVAPFYFIGMMFMKSHSLERTKIYAGKLILAIMLAIMSFLKFLVGVMDYLENPMPYVAQVVSPAIQTLTFVLVCVIIEAERRKGLITSGVLFLFFLIAFIAGVVPLYSYILLAMKMGHITDIFHFTDFIISFVFILGELVLFSFADSHPRVLCANDNRDPCPEIESSFLSRIAFFWVHSLVVLGYKKSLEENDVFLPNPRDLTSNTGPTLEKVWTQEMKKCGCTGTAHRNIPSKLPSGLKQLSIAKNDDKDFNESTPLLNGISSYTSAEESIEVKRPKKSPSFVLTLIRVFGFYILEAHAGKLIADILTFIGPMVQGLLISYTTDPSVEHWKGYLYIALLFASTVVSSTLSQQNFHLSNTLGMRIKAAVISVIYKKALTMSNDARRTTTIGEIVNLMSVDAERIMEVVQYLWMIWSSPLQICIAIYLLYGILGPAVFAGLAAILIMFPISSILASIEAKLQTKVMGLKDQRIKLMTEVLNGMKVLKLHAWELSFIEKIEAIRNQELRILKLATYLQAVGTLTWSCAPFLVTLATFATYVLLGGVLDSEKAFTSLSLFNILRFPITLLPMVISYVIAASVSVKRIGKYLQTADIDAENVSHDHYSESSVVIENGTFAWGLTKDDFPILQNINISVPNGCFTAIVGPVGSGKSSIISAILGEMEKIDGKVNVNGSVAYVAQQAWLQNMTLKDNILFGEPYDARRYNMVLDACALRPDLEILPAADLTEIGEKGINLSGGQKQRISLARAVYQDRDIYLFDDPLSAVDSLVGRHLFEQVFSSSGLLSNKTRILVTHGLQYLPKVDNIIVLLNGSVSEIGSYEMLMSHDGPFAQFLKTYLISQDDDKDPEVEKVKSEILERIDSLIDTEHQDRNSDMEFGSICVRPQLPRKSNAGSTTEVIEKEEKDREGEKKQPDRLIEEEGVEEGQVKWSVFLSYARALGFIMSFLLLASYLLFEASSMFSNIWLSEWTEDKDLQNMSLVNSTHYKNKMDLYLGVYGGFGLLQSCFVLMYAFLTAYSSIRASRNLHNNMLQCILRLPLSFFDTTPIGRIINRFSRDIEVIDTLLPETIQSWLVTFFGVVSTMIILCYSTPIFLVVVVPVFILYYFIQRYYIPTSRQLKRISSRTRSPIYVHFSETVTGASTIRAYGVEQRFVQASEAKVDYNLGFVYAAFASNRWLGFRLELLGAFIVMAAALFAVLGRGVITGGLVGLSISYALQVTVQLNWLVRMTTDLETNMVAVERVEEYTNVPPEGEWYINQTIPDPKWPQSGGVVFHNYSTRYRPGLELVLKNINVTITPGEKIGIVGRTGAGKSSLTLALFRIIEPVGGDIAVDNIYITTLGLHQLRSTLTILPQDPVLFSGTLRMNLDPVNQYTDEEIWKSLFNAHLKNFVESLPARLEYECGEGGQNLSVGQRQLVCLARALLKKTKVLILDEATAAVDLETDELIQNTIRTEFADCTVITIAHRINTIMDCDKVLVMDVGEVKEFNSPSFLLQQPDSTFYAMARDAGIVKEKE